MRKGFTLIELIIIIGVLTVLAGATVILLNPPELFAIGRDNKRIQDMASIDKALTLYQISGGIALGDAQTLYISLPDTAGDGCNTSTGGTAYSLPNIAPWVYKCVSASNLRNIDGTGWIPVAFSSFPSESGLVKLPVDPTNTPTKGLYYTYAKGSWVITALLESKKHRFLGDSDGGSTSRYEIGNDLDIMVAIGGSFGGGAPPPPPSSTDRFWVGGTGSWSQTSHWSITSGGTPNATLPGSNSMVYFDENSFSGSNQTVTVDVSADVLGIDWAGSLFTPAMILNANLTTHQ